MGERSKEEKEIKIAKQKGKVSSVREEKKKTEK